MSIKLDTSQVTAMAARFAKAATRVKPDKVTKHFGAVLLLKTKAFASGRPGPNAPHGNYRDSIKVRFEHGMHGGESIAIVYSNAPQANRLEFGFKGQDSAGRDYNQPAFPHFGPALDDMNKQFPAGVEKAVDEWTSGI